MRSRATAAVQFRILGPLAVSRDGEGVRLGGERQRALLALLLVRANEMVSTDWLVEQLFGPQPSPGAVNALYVAVSRLRRTLSERGEQVLVTRGGGYLLALEPQQLDAIMFERLLDEGRALVASGDPSAGSERLGEALALWHGPPLADLSTVEGLQPEIRRLDELRLLALMERIDADLSLGRAREVVGELERLIAREPLQERLRGQLMLALYRSGRQADALAAYRETSELLRDELGLTPSPELRELERRILRQDEGLEPSAARAEAPWPVLCPFKGLAAFDSSDAEFFCGRDRIVSELIARLAEWPLVGILGPSGIGKSSLLRAGVLPALQAGALPDSARWRQAVVRPGEHPVDELERTLGGDLGQMLQRLDPAGRLVIAVDQLEELFTVCEQEAERYEFLAALVRAASDANRRVLVLCTLRADFYGRFSTYPEFAELISRSHALVGPMHRDELVEAIERPVARAGLEIEPRLVEALVIEVGDEPGGLPLLSTTLLELWLARDGRTLRLQDYRATGGLRGAVARIAEAAFTRLSHRDRGVARKLLLRLVDVGEGAPERRRVRLTEIKQIDGADQVLATLTDARLLTVSAGAVELSHEALVREWPRYRGWLEEDRAGRRLHAHLRVASAEWDARGRDPGDLYRGARLAGALDFCAQHGDEVDRPEREFVAASRAEAERETQRQRFQNRRLRGLLAGTGALLILTVVAGVMAILGQRKASIDARLAVAEAHAALGRQLGAEAINESRLDVAALLAREGVGFDRSAQTEGTLLSVLLRSPAVIGALSLSADSAPQVAVSPDGRTLAVSDSAAGQVRLYDARSRAPLGQAVSDFRGDQPPTYSGDGSLLVYPSSGALVVRDAGTMAMRKRLPIPAPFRQQLTADIPDGSIAITPDRQLVYYAYWLVGPAGQPTNAYLSRWSLASGRSLPTVRLGPGPLLALRLIDGGDDLMIVTAHDIATYDARTGRRTRLEAIHPAPLLPTAAAISPDGAAVAIGSHTGAVSFVDASTGAARRSHRGQSTAVESTVFAPGGRAVMTVNNGGTVIVWNPGAGTKTAVLSGPAGRVRDATISPSGSTLYTAAVGGAVLAWDLTGGRSFGRTARLTRGWPCCEQVTPPTPPLAISPDGSRFAVVVGGSTVGVFSTDTLRRQASFTIEPAGEPITALAWSPRGAALAVGAHGGVVQLWSVKGKPHLEHLLLGLAPHPGQPEAIQALAFSPDGALLAAADKSLPPRLGHLSASQAAAAMMAIWATSTGQLLGPPTDLGPGNTLGGSEAVAFSRDGRLLAATMLGGGVRIFEPSTGQALRTLADPGNNTVSLAFSRKGTLAAGTLGGTVDIWNPTTGKKLGPPLLADAAAPITSLAFDRSGEWLATAGYEDGSIKLWSSATFQQEGRLVSNPGATSAVMFEPSRGDLVAFDDHGGVFTWPISLRVWEERACSLASPNLTRARWAQLVGGPGYATVCSAATHYPTALPATR
jgi:DNA-binding SARP family transcriptional activator/WD40 repeat protein